MTTLIRVFKAIFVRSVKYGDIRPMFYLPIHNIPDKRAVLCWLIFIAPFMLLAYLVTQTIYMGWTDAVNIIHRWNRKDV